MIRNKVQYFKLSDEEEYNIRLEMEKLGISSKSEYFRYKILSRYYQCPVKKE